MGRRLVEFGVLGEGLSGCKKCGLPLQLTHASGIVTYGLSAIIKRTRIEDTDTDGEDVVPKKKKTPLPKNSTTEKPKRLRQPQSCPHCRKTVINIWRHMKNIQKIPSVPNEDFIRSKKGYIIKRCPYKGCLAVVDRMTDHLVRKHKLARKSYQLKRMQMKAEDVPSTCEVSGRKRQNINKHIKKRTNFET
ncbi:unnamed protein product [Mytilus edulis]|uniref:Uncharacterized protein n=1 Tax=Mytilus edulis TaxID=6550 RepID=A0A8S3S1M0_MYTED|nr:unnamed protein product [Mytilus edulis]